MFLQLNLQSSQLELMRGRRFAGEQSYRCERTNALTVGRWQM